MRHLKAKAFSISDILDQIFFVTETFGDSVNFGTKHFLAEVFLIRDIFKLDIYESETFRTNWVVH